MNFREHEKGGNLFSAIEYQQKMTKHTVEVLKLKTIIDWNAFLATLIQVTGYDKKDWSKGGYLPFHSILMFQILIIQILH